MTFINDDDRLIIMDFGGGGPTVANLLELDELRELKAAGVQTIYYQSGFRWNEMQPERDKPIDWTRLDTYIDRIEAAGLQCLIPFLYRCPDWLGEDWFLKWDAEMRDAYPLCPAYNSRSGRDLDDLALAAIERYRDRNLQFIYSIPIDGEFAFPLLENRSEPTFPVQDFLDWMDERQSILETQYGEIWNAFHLVDNPSWIDAMYHGQKDNCPEARQFALQFRYWDKSEELHRHVIRLQQQGVRYFVGADYLPGLMEYSVKGANTEGVGLLLAPIAAQAGYGRLMRWHVRVIANAIEELSRVRAA